MQSALPIFYTPDGSQNNALYPQRGAMNTPRIRAHPPLHAYIDDYANDDIDSSPLWHHPRLDLPSARRIFVELFQKVPPRENERASQLLMYFAHQLVRDMTRTEMLNETQPWPIECDMVETRGSFCPMGQESMDFFRAARWPKNDEVGYVPSNTGEPINCATTWLDMDHIYGNAPPSSPDYLNFRTGEGGHMKLDSSTRLPPVDENGKYLVYDDRMRWTPMDLALTATFLHYHNKRADYYLSQNPDWSDETLFYNARMDVVAVYQSAFEGKYIHALLGEPLSSYEGYDPEVDASIDVFFSTCSFRYGHSGLSSLVRFIDKDWAPIPRDPMLLRDVYNHTEEVVNQLGGGRLAAATVMRGLAHDATKAPDANFVDDVTLFTEGHVITNIQRGRDNGIPTYNEAREWFGMERAQSYLDLADGNEVVAKALAGLYGEGNIDDVDAYVGAMLEKPTLDDDVIGPLNKASLRDQFERLRSGDVFYYRNRLSPEEIQELPTLSELIKDAWGEDEMLYFPEDLFAIGNSGQGQGTTSIGGEMELFEGDLTVRWTRTIEEHLDFTITTLEQIIGGYIGIGWGSNTMRGAEIWFCESNAEFKPTVEGCNADVQASSNEGPFSCCVAQGEQHVRPICGNSGYITVLDSCASDAGSYVSIRAQMCLSDEDDNCFRLGSTVSEVDFIAAYSPVGVNAAHGFSRRTGGATSLALGTAATCSDDSAQAGLFALHGATLLTAWLVLAPVAIYVVRYKKDKPWRLRVHITLVGIVGGMMIALVTAALVSVEGTSFGTVDAESATFSTHKTIGLCIIVFVLYMITTGELRRTRTLSKKTKSMTAERIVIISHRLGGLLLVGFAWYNCYTGLVQIGPYESDSVEVTFFSSKTVSMGYDLELFGFIRKYIFFPWIGIVLLAFAVTEVRMRRASGKLSHNIDMSRKGAGKMLIVDRDLQKMSVDTFLFLTKHGNALSTIDGYVIDISTFMDVHPGGTNVLRFAIGSDITPYFIGDIDINGLRHKHSPSALRALQPLIKFKLEDGEDITQASSRRIARKSGVRNSIVRLARGSLSRGSSIIHGHFFRRATVAKNEVISGTKALGEKSVIRLSISMKRDDNMDLLLGTPPPTCTFIIRAVDSAGNAFERPYNAVQAYLSSPEEKFEKYILPLRWHSKRKIVSEEIVYDFFITIVPGGRMSQILSKKHAGKGLMVKGPLVSKNFLEKIKMQSWTEVCVVVQGAGITPGLQLIDYYLNENEMISKIPKITLIWLVRYCSDQFEDAVQLEKRTSEKFRYLIISDEDATSSSICNESVKDSEDLSDDDTEDLQAKQDFLHNYHSNKNILDKDTAASLLHWAGNKQDTEVTSSVPGPMTGNSNDDQTSANLTRIGDALRTGLKLTERTYDDPCFFGRDAVSFLVHEGYTPTRDSALALGRELAEKLNLFKHTSDEKEVLLDEANQTYVFIDTALGQELTAKLNQISRNKHRSSLCVSRQKGLLVALCAHSKFETDMTELLQKIGLDQDQIFRFPEGSVPLSSMGLR